MIKEAAKDEESDLTQSDARYISGQNKTESNIEASFSANSANINHTRSKNKKLTLLTEFETIELAIQIIDLVDVLHQKKIVHTNLNPKNIFLKDQHSPDKQMCFLNLYHCSWQPSDILHNINLGMECDDNISLFDNRTRDRDYISPEQT